MWAWGDNAYGQVGNPAARRSQTSPVQVDIGDVTASVAGGTDALAVKADGTVWAWGNNDTVQIGDGAACGKTCTAPVRTSGLAGAAEIAGG